MIRLNIRHLAFPLAVALQDMRAESSRQEEMTTTITNLKESLIVPLFNSVAVGQGFQQPKLSFGDAFPRSFDQVATTEARRSCNQATTIWYEALWSAAVWCISNRPEWNGLL